MQTKFNLYPKEQLPENFKFPQSYIAVSYTHLQFTPGDPATVALGESASEAAKQLYRESHGLNDPLFVQYFRFLGNLLVLDFGVTMPPELPISSMLAKSFPITLQLTLIGVVFAAVVSFSLGVLAALYRDSWVDQVLSLIHILSRPDGERKLTDLLHLAEILQQAAALNESEAALLRWFEKQIQDNSRQEAQIRLESERQLVKIVTIHKSKGLELSLIHI